MEFVCVQSSIEEVSDPSRAETMVSNTEDSGEGTSTRPFPLERT